MPEQVFDINNKPQALGDCLGRGGEGSAHRLIARPELAVKIYADERLTAQGKQLQRKVEAQIAAWPQVQQLPVAWPRLSVFDAKGRWIGYAMRCGTGPKLRYLASPVLSARHFPKLSRRFIVNALISLTETVARLHGHGIYLGDVNLNNFLCDPDSARVTLIDCDSFQMTDAKGRLFPCPVGSPDTTAPEHLGADFASTRRTAESDAFSLAILLFQCLMLGRHPYDSVGGCNPVENLRRGHFPYGLGGARPGTDGAIPEGPWYLIWSHLSGKLKGAFIQTFTAGATDPDQRTSVADWTKLLRQYRHAIEQGWLSDEVRPRQPKASGSSSSAPPRQAAPRSGTTLAEILNANQQASNARAGSAKPSFFDRLKAKSSLF